MARNKYDIDETLETPFNIKHLKRSLKYAGRYKKQILLALFISVVTCVISLFEPLISQYAIDNSIANGNVIELLLLAGLFMALVVIGVLFYRYRSKIMMHVGQNIVYDIRKDLFEHLQRLSFEYYDTRPHGKILVRVINYINSISDIMTNGIIDFVMELLNLLFIAVFMFFVSWQLALAVLIGLPLLAIVLGIIENRQRKAWQAVSNKTSNMNAYLHESIVGVRITQIFTREEKNEEIFNKLSHAYRKEWMNAVKYSNLVWPAVDNISTIVSALIFLTGLVILADMNISLGVIFAMTSYSARFWRPLMNLSNLMNTFITAISYLERIFETLDEPVLVDNAPDAVPMPPIMGNVRFENVTFGYEQDAPVIENLSFTVKAGESIALVGPTGAGKTTIVNLISRFYNLNSGTIYIDDMDISKVTLYSLRSQMGIMLQDSFIFSGTIMDNLRYGKLDATEEEVSQACAIVGADKFIREMKDGYYTEVKERGEGLSQGQKQLIAFARTILADPKILVLDEATSSIDAQTERYLQQGLNHLLKGRTSFIIAHRLSTIRNCDRIFYVSDKGIIEDGNHEELMAKKGAYYDLYTTQMI
jgi:ATP-binding cassette subfamily B multidrug efflux pump